MKYKLTMAIVIGRGIELSLISVMLLMIEEIKLAALR